MRNNKNTEEDTEEEKVKIQPYHYFPHEIPRLIHHYYLTDFLYEPIHYIEMVHQIANASPDDIIYVHINTKGGDLSSGVQLINAFKSSQSTIIASLEAEAYSLGTLIFLAADQWVVHDNCMMMFHNYSGTAWGKGNEQIAQIAATSKWFTQLATDLYVPFLSEEEVAAIIKGEDLWLQTPDIRKRLEKMVKILEKERKIAEKEQK